MWNQTFDLNLVSFPKVEPTFILTIELFDHDRVGQVSKARFLCLGGSERFFKHDFLGSAHADMSGLVMGMEKVIAFCSLSFLLLFSFSFFLFFSFVLFSRCLFPPLLFSFFLTLPTF